MRLVWLELHVHITISFLLKVLIIKFCSYSVFLHSVGSIMHDLR